MTKIAKKIWIIFCSFLFVLCLSIGGLFGLNANKNVIARAETTTAVEFTGFGSLNNEAWTNASYEAVYLEFNGTFTKDTSSLTSGSVTYTKPGATAQTFQFNWANINGCGENVVAFVYGAGTMTEGTVLHIEGGTVIGGKTLPELTFVLNNGAWTNEPTVEFTGFGSLNNEAWTNASYEAVDLEFDGTCTVNTQAITSGSVTYTKPGATAQTFGFNWANINNCGENVVAFVYGTGTMTEGTVLHIADGTIMGGQILPELTFVLNNGAWVKVTPAQYLGISHNMTDVVSNGRLSLGLQFNQPLSDSASTNLFDGNTLNIYLDGVQLVNGNFSPRCYSDINDYTVMQLLFKNALGSEGTYAAGVTLQKGTKLEIKDSIVNGYELPDITLYFNGKDWQNADPNVDTAKFLGIYSDGTTTYNMVEAPTKPGRYMIALEYDQVLNAEATASFSLFAVSVTLDGKATQNFLIRNSNNITNTKIVEVMFNTWATADTAYTKDGTITSSNMPVGTRLDVSGSANGYTLETVTLYYNGTNWQKENPKVDFVKIDEAINHYADSEYFLTDLKFSFDTTTNAQYIWFGTAAEGYEDLASKIYWTAYGETTKNSFDIIFGMNGNVRLMDHNTRFPTAYATITIEEGTVIEGHVLPATTLYVAEDGKWTTEEQTPPAASEPVANFIELKNGGVFDSTNGVYLKFDKSFNPILDGHGTANTDSDGDLANKLTWNGNKITPYGNVNIWHNWQCKSDDESSPYIEIIFANGSQSNLNHGDVLHIPEGTLFGGYQLSEVTVYFNAAESKWQTEKPAPIVNGFSTVEGGSIRIDKENGGLRFETHIEKSTYDSLVATYGKGNIKMGTYILPEAWLYLSGKTLEGYVTTYTADGGYYLDISTWNEAKNDFGFANSNAAGEITDGNSYYKYYGTIAKVKEENYAENFIGVGYIWVTDKDGVEYLYLTHDGSWSRNVYEVAKAAYKDTEKVKDNQLGGITPYFDKVIEITTDGSAENKLVYDIDEVLTARPSYSYTKPTDYTVTVENGVITIASTSTATLTVIVNGSPAGKVETNATAYADYYAVNAALFETAEEAKKLNFGFAEPNRELYSQGNDGFNSIFNGETNAYSTSSNIAQVTAEFDGNSARIWFQTADLCWSSSNSDAQFVLNESCLNALKQVINNFRAQGVTNIILMSSVANTRQTKNYYNSDNNTWYTFWEVMENNYSYDGQSLSLVVLPNEDDYDTFLALQKEYFTQLALAVGDSVTAIEVLNEMEGATNYRFHYENGYLPAIDLIAQAAMDICKAATDGVKEAGKNIKIAMPALMTVSELKNDSGNVTRYESKAFVEAEYAYIKSVGGNADDYFQIINMHPYVTLSSDTSTTNYLYYENNGLTVQTPAQMKERWLKYMNSLRSIFVANGDAEKPVWITEFGLADYNGDCKDPINSNKWKDYNNNKLLRQAQVYQAIYDAMISLPYLDTVLFFRLGDYTHTGEHNYVNCGEATYGVIDASGNLKDFGKYLYAIANGVNVFTDSNYTTLKSLDALGTINGKTVTELATNVNTIY